MLPALHDDIGTEKHQNPCKRSVSSYLSISCSYLQREETVQAESDHDHGQQHSGHVAQVAQGLYQGNASHLPVIAQHDGGEQQPGIEGQKVRKGQNPGERGKTEKKKSMKGRKCATLSVLRPNHKFNQSP